MQRKNFYEGIILFYGSDPGSQPGECQYPKCTMQNGTNLLEKIPCVPEILAYNYIIKKRNRKENEMSIKRIAIYDMDGTIVDSTHRYRTMPCGTKIDLEYWRANEDKAYNDSLLPLAEQYKADLNDPECYTIIATARIIRDEDMRFIIDKLGMPNHIISRKEGDSISGGLLKIKGLKKFFNLKNFKNAWNNAVFYEDNTNYLKAVCDYFNIRGVYVPSKQGH